MIQTQRYCRMCQRYTLHARSNFGFGVGCIATLLTGCLFLPVWLFLSLWFALFSSYRCQICGSTNPISARPPRVARRPAPIAYTAARKAIPVTPDAPSGIGALVGIVGRAAVELPAISVGLASSGWRSVKATYSAMPEWAQPIVWGLGIASPIVTTLIVLRFLFG